MSAPWMNESSMIIFFLSFLCKEREEKFNGKSYNKKDKFMSIRTICADQEGSHGMGRKIKPKHKLY